MAAPMNPTTRWMPWIKIPAGIAVAVTAFQMTSIFNNDIGKFADIAVGVAGVALAIRGGSQILWGRE